MRVNSKLSSRCPAGLRPATSRAITPVTPSLRKQNTLHHQPYCVCSGCRDVTAKATIKISMNGTEVKLNHVKAGSNVELDIVGDEDEAPPAPSTPAASTTTSEEAPATPSASSSNGSLAPGAAAAAPGVQSSAEHLAERTSAVQKHLPKSLAADDFLSRAELLLCAHGFRGDNSIAVTNVCRDESTGILKAKIDSIFGSCFNVNGLGAVLTCGVTGMGAGLSHAPIDPSTGRERYVFFSFPHIAVDETGKVGSMHRPGREGASAACGALITALAAFKQEGLESHLVDPGNHDIAEPEFSILKQRIARRMAGEGADMEALDLVGITKVAERTITSDLEFLIENAVDTNKADYAVVTGIQVHSWPSPESGMPALEFVMPSELYVVVDGEKSIIDISSIPALTPRQAAILSAGGSGKAAAAAFLEGSTVMEVAQGDPAGHPSVKAAEQRGVSVKEVMFKYMQAQNNRKGRKGGQASHKKPEWADTYCC